MVNGLPSPFSQKDCSNEVILVIDSKLLSDKKKKKDLVLKQYKQFGHVSYKLLALLQRN